VNNLESIYAERPAAAEFADGYLGYLSEILAKLDRGQIAEFIDALLDAQRRGATVYFLGNGGSAATASHFQNDLTRWRENPMRVVSLTDNVAVLTAIGNDHGYEQVFRMQLENLLLPGDLVVAISVSGNSPNVIQAMEYAISKGATTVGLTGFDGGRLAAMVDINVHAPTLPGEYGPAEDVHLILDHLIGSFLWEACVAQARELDATKPTTSA
jgi:D-sedoheptulose 7-phosphate isomerase